MVACIEWQLCISTLEISAIMKPDKDCTLMSIRELSSGMQSLKSDKSGASSKISSDERYWPIIASSTKMLKNLRYYSLLFKMNFYLSLYRFQES